MAWLVMLDFSAGVKFLADNGLNMISVSSCIDLPDQTVGIIASSGIPLANYRQLVLIGHGGRLLWEKMHSTDLDNKDPVDHFSGSITRQFIRDYLDNAAVLWLYPDSRYSVPLQQLGEAAGWCSPSPLGLGISADYGLWFAYRALFLINSNLPMTSALPHLSPCNRCAQQPCITACPPEAAQKERLNMALCARHRLAPHSSCADRCLSRLACPVHPEHRYEPEQIQYHYQVSLATLRHWYSAQEAMIGK